MGKPVVHWQLLSKDPAKLSEFYRKDLRLQDSAHCRNELPLG